MSTNISQETDVKVEIQKTLVSINEVTLKIRAELDIINEIIKENGMLHSAVLGANQTLGTVAQEMGLNIEKIRNTNENGTELEMSLPNRFDAMSFTDKILSCMKY